MVNLKMPDLNSVTIAGNLTNDPTFRKTNNGTPVVNFYLASNRKYKDNSGQWRENVCFVGVVAWHRLAESCFEYLTKGSAVLVEGELQSRYWKNDDGSNNNVVEIKARRIQFLDRQSKKDEAVYLLDDDTSEDSFDVNSDVFPGSDYVKPATSPDTDESHNKTEASNTNFGYTDL